MALFEATAGEAGAVYMRRLGSLRSGEFAFWRPLYNLSLTVPQDRQFNLTPFTRYAEGVGTLCVFPMNERVSLPRWRKREGTG